MHIIYVFHSSLLISLDQLCDNDCAPILDENTIYIPKGKKLILK